MRLFFLLLPVYISFAYSGINPVLDSTYRWKLLESVIRGFIGNQASISVFDIDKDRSLDSRKDVLHQVLNAITPVFVYDGLDSILVEEISDMGGELENPLKAKSYVAMSASTALIDENLKHFARINTNGKWVFSLILVTSEEVEALLIKAWTTFRMANILAIYSDLVMDLFVKSYNPFQLKGEQHGVFFTESVNIETLLAINKELIGVFERKVSNLQQYPLKATKVPETSEQDVILDTEMKKIFEKILNTNFTIFESSEGKFQRTRFPNGSFIGERTFGCVMFES